MVLESMRMILPYWLISITSEFSVYQRDAYHFPYALRRFDIDYAFAGAVGQAVFVGRGTLAISVFGYGEDQRAFLS